MANTNAVDKQDILTALKVGGNNRATCPYCIASGHRTRKQNLIYNPVSGKYFCFRCSRKGFVGKDENFVPQRQSPTAIEYPNGWTELGLFNTQATHKARSYAKGRGISDIAIYEMGMACATEPPDEGKQDFRNRLLVPIRTLDGSLVGVVGRSLSKQPKLPYMYTAGMHRNIVYNEKAIYQETNKPVFVVEGVLDAAYLWPNAVAVLGTWGNDQLRILKQAKRPVVALLDGDAWRKGDSLAYSLRLSGVRSGHVRLPPGKDPDDMPHEWIRARALESYK